MRRVFLGRAFNAPWRWRTPPTFGGDGGRLGAWLGRSLLVGLLWGVSSGCTLPLAEPVERAPASAVAPASTKVRLATWNVANFFDTTDHPGNDTVLSGPKFERKVREIATVVDSLEADFIGLVEVENLDCLKALNRALDKPYPHLGLIEGNDTERGIDVAFVSRLPVEAVISHKDYDLPDAPGVSKNYKFSRDCLEVRLATEPPVTIFVNHFKSQLGGAKTSAAKRRVQAQAVVEIAGRAAVRSPEGLEVVMGDLNDRPQSWSLEPLMANFVDAFEGWPESHRKTHRSRYGGSALDHILLSRDALPRLGEPKVWRDRGKPTSDHDPIGVTLGLDDPGQPVLETRVWALSDHTP